MFFEPGPMAGLLEEDAGSADFLRAQGVQEARDQLVHQLEVRRKRRGVLLSVVEHLLVERFGVERGSRTAIDENELRSEDEAFTLLERADRDDAPAAELVVDFTLRHHEAGVLRRREKNGARDDQRVLVFLTELLPERRVGEDALVLLEILLAADLGFVVVVTTTLGGGGRFGLRRCARGHLRDRR